MEKIMKNQRETRMLSTAVFDVIRERILNGELLPGQKLKISQLAETHKVSLNVVREALNRLTGEQLVDLAPQQGFTVRALSEDDLIDLFAQRIIFEGIALRQSIINGDLEWQSRVLAAHHRLSRTPAVDPENPDRLNPEWLSRHEEFNVVMMACCGSPRLIQMVRQLAEAAALYQRALLPTSADRAERNSEHDDLLEAILEGEADKAVVILTRHLEQTRDVMLPVLRQGGGVPQANKRAAVQLVGK
ncbi:GntR family transcriptional regulator [Alloalcanivorax marinus]|uniref:GntR family transcriptional regulator n=1 Tax=Alloalcanivorax marinus TaxID=1177169 RepID=UPI0019329E94|nr:GntR family transcriptional regulator [Alloalcanivorax marinus]MBL7251100.1 GntR family transcriptional regulator [Alloalcanivorax marinus]